MAGWHGSVSFSFWALSFEIIKFQRLIYLDFLEHCYTTNGGKSMLVPSVVLLYPGGQQKRSYLRPREPF